MNKKLLAIVAVVVVLAAGVFGYIYFQGARFSSPFTKTTGGISFEDLMPQDSFLVASFNPSSPEQRQKFNVIWDTVFQDKKDAVIPYIFQTIARETAGTFFTDNLEKTFGNELKIAIAYSGSPDEKVAVNIFMTAKDPAAVVKKAKEYPTKTDVGTIGDVVFIVKKGEAENVIARSKGKMKSLAKTSGFKKAVAGLSPANIGYVYVDIAKIDKSAEPMVYSAGVFSATENGLMFDTASVGDKEYTEKSSMKSLLNPYVATLYKKIPAQNLIGFGEIHNVGDLVLAQLAEIEKAANMKEKSLLGSFKEATGFDFQTDILPLTNKGAVGALYNADATVVPAIAFYFDVTGSAAKAKEVVGRLDKILASVITFANSLFGAKENEPVITAEKFATIKDGGIIKIYLDRIPSKMANVPLFQKLPAPLEVSYGLTEDDMLFVATVPGVEKYLAVRQSMDKFVPLQDALSLGVAPGNIVAMDMNVFWNYVDKIVQFARVQNSFSKENEEAFAILKKHLSTIKNYVQVSNGDGINVRGKGFLRISPKQ